MVLGGGRPALRGRGRDGRDLGGLHGGDDSVGSVPTPQRRIDLNADLGEEVTDDAALLAVVTSANVACGYHARTAAIMRAVCEEAAVRGRLGGAQVSYADRENFGRVARGGAARRAPRAGGRAGRRPGLDRRRVRYVGALPPSPRAPLPPGDRRRGAGRRRAGWLGRPAGARHAGELRCRRSPRVGWSTARGSPTAATAPTAGCPRGEPGAVVETESEIVAQALALAARVDSLCLHGDSRERCGTRPRVRAALVGAGLDLRPFT